MTYYDEQLRQLQEKIARAKQLEAMAAELRRQASMLSAKVPELKVIMKNEQADVERL